jgi:SAM-dependent methyltransferase
MPANLGDPAVAADYDLIYANWDAQVERLVAIMNGHLPVIPHGRLLDASCGSGLAVDAAQRAGWIVTGCDPSPAMLQRARDRFPVSHSACPACSACPMRSGHTTTP